MQTVMPLRWFKAAVVAVSLLYLAGCVSEYGYLSYRRFTSPVLPIYTPPCRGEQHVESLPRKSAPLSLPAYEHKLYVRPMDMVHGWKLGNMMSVYASLIGVARHNGRIPVWWSDTKLSEFFKTRSQADSGDEDRILRDQRCDFRPFGVRLPMVYDNKTERLPLRNISLNGYLQSWKYISHVKDELKERLTFKEDYIRKAEKFLAKHVSLLWNSTGGFIRVVIHARRGDYQRQWKIDEGWTFPDAGYFTRAMEFFKKCFRRVQFVVLSDDIDWCIQNIRGDNVIYSTRNDPVVDWAIASLCDHAIITFGTFGIWAAWFADGITITPKCFPAPNSTLLRRFRREDYFRPEWLSL